jgi:hypothetical protein
VANSKVLIEVIATSKGLKVVAKDTEKTVAATKKLGQEQKKTTKSTKNLNKEHARNDRLNKSVYQSNLSAAKGFSKQKEMIGTGSSGLVAAYATLAANIFAATAAFGALQRASEVNTLIEGFSVIARQSGRSAMNLAEGLREAAGGALSLEAALRAASIGTTSGFTADEMERLTTVARNASIALGRNLADATDRLFRGVAKLEPEILDELGILVRIDDAAEAYATTLQKAATQLSRAERQQAFLNATLDQGELKYGALSGAVDENPFTKLSAAFQDLTREVLNLINKAIVPLAEVLTRNVTLMVGTLVLFASTIVKTMFPALTELGKRQAFTAGETARAAAITQQAARDEVAAIKARVTAAKVGGSKVKEIQLQLRQNKTVKDYGKVLKALRISETQRENNLEKFSGKELARKKRELQAVKDLKNEVLKLQKAEAGVAGAGRDAQRLRGLASAQRSGAAGLERIGQSTGVGGFKQAGKELDTFKKKLLVTEKRAGNFTKGAGFTTFGKKAAFGFRLAGQGARFFGAALINAIPLIGQIIFIVGLAIEGITALVGRFKDQVAENNKLAIANKEVTKGLKELQERNEALNERLREGETNLNAFEVAAVNVGNEIKFVAGATDEFRNNLKEITEQIGEKEINIFDRAGASIGRFFSNIGQGVKNAISAGWENFTNGLSAIKNFVMEDLGLGDAIELTEADQDAEKFLQLEQKLKDADPLQTIRENLSGPTAEKFAERFDETFGEGGVVGLLRRFQEEGMTFEQASEKVNQAVAELAEPFGDTQDAINGFAQSFLEANKQLNAFKNKAKQKNEFRVLEETLRKTFDVNNLIQGVTNADTGEEMNPLLTSAEAQAQMIAEITKAGGIGALESFGITTANMFDEITNASGESTTRIQQFVDDLEELAIMSDEFATAKRLSGALLAAEKAASRAAMALKQLQMVRENVEKTGKVELTPAQQTKMALDNAKESARLAKFEYDNKINLINLETKFLTLKAKLTKSILGEEYQGVIDLIAAVDEASRKAAKGAYDTAIIGAETATLTAFSNAAQTGTLAERGAAFANLSSGVSVTDITENEDGTTTETVRNVEATAAQKLKAIQGVVTPMIEELNKLGPEGELVASVTNGIFGIANAFQIMGNESATSAEKMEAIGGVIGQIGAIMAASSKAQIAEIDQQIETEKKRDGKSKESLAKIEALEKKKVAMEKKAFERNKKVMMAQTIMNTAAGVMATMKDTGFFGSPLAMIVAAMGAAQLAIISKQKFQGGTGNVEKPTMTNLTIGKRSDAVDVSQRATGGELNYLRGGRTTGGDLGGAGGFLPGSAMGRKGYAMGFRRGYADGGIVVGERGPEVITPSTDVDIVPNFALGGGSTNVNFSINAIDASGVEDVLTNQRGNIIRMIREAANENGERFLETIDTQTYGSSS